MMEEIHSLKYLKEFGWQLETDGKEFRCLKCGVLLSVPLMFCVKNKIFYCEKCNKGMLSCERMDLNTHEHFKIVRVKRTI